MPRGKRKLFLLFYFYFFLFLKNNSHISNQNNFNKIDEIMHQRNDKSYYLASDHESNQQHLEFPTIADAVAAPLERTAAAFAIFL